MLQASSSDEMDAWQASLMRCGVFPDNRKADDDEEGETDGEGVCSALLLLYVSQVTVLTDPRAV